MWNNLGKPPQSSEVEVTVIGPGHGESVLVHLGQGKWLIVDSCIDTTDPSRPVAPLRYLRELGVKVDTAVDLIVASHWDDDHIQGIGDVVEACPNARFVCSIFPIDKFACFVEALSIGSMTTNGASVRNMRKVIELLSHRKQPLVRAAPAKQLFPNPLIHSWSPSSHDDTQFLYYLAQMHPKAMEPHRKAILGSGNTTSIVLSVVWSDTSVLLCADMEKTADTRSGWDAVFSEIQAAGKWSQGSLVKIPHHGSHTGHFDPMWQNLLHPNPISVIAPFGKGPIASRPPKSTDIHRISGKSGAAYLTAKHNEQKSANKKEAAVVRSLREGGITLTSSKSSIGIVRHRKSAGAPWTHELFGTALRVK